MENNIPEHLKNSEYYKNNPVPAKFQEIKPEYRVRDLATGKWLNKYSGGKSWYRKSSALNALQERQRRSPHEPGRFVLEQYIVGIQVVSTGEEEIRQRNIERENKRSYELFKKGGINNIDKIVRQDYNSTLDELLKLPKEILDATARQRLVFYNEERNKFKNLTFNDYMEQYHEKRIRV